MEASTQFFTAFEKEPIAQLIPKSLSLMLDQTPHPLCELAAADLQHYLLTQQDFKHNFGLSANDQSAIVGKMFGVLVVQTKDGQIGYLAAFSGKLAGRNQHHKFVPPVFDLLEENSFLHAGMQELTVMTDNIKALEQLKPEDLNQIKLFKASRKTHSITLQKQIFDQYHFLNQSGEEKGLQELFSLAGYQNPPAGAGECAAPKLLQHAFKNGMKPLALAEFWWGLSPKSAHWKHSEFYPCCKEKCEPILAHMLNGTDLHYQ